MNENRETCVPLGVNQKETGFGYTLSVIGGKYKMTILYCLAEHHVLRPNELMRRISGIPYKTLSIMLKELETDGLILRKDYAQIPPKVEYRLTELGLSVIPILHMMCDWGEKNKNFNRIPPETIIP